MIDKKLLIFDLDGTLIDSVPDLSDAINYMLKTTSRETFSEDVIRNWVGNGAKTLVQRSLDIKEDISEELNIFLNYYSKNLTNKTTVYSGVKEVLSELKKSGYKLAIVTNKPFEFVEPILKANNLNTLFDIVLGADSLEKKKPHPMPLLHVAKELNISLKDTLMIGDSKNDILSAKSAGITSIAVTYGYNYDEDISKYEPDFIVDSFYDIQKLLSKPKVAVIGGGVAGSTASVILSNSGADVTLFEERDSLVSGPPFCHLHSGGNLYPDITIDEKLKLLEQSIELLRLYPNSIDVRPTVITIPKRYNKTPQDIVDSLEKLKQRYSELVKEDKQNKVLGDVEEYYKLYDKDELLKSSSSDKWINAFVKYVDLDKLKYPIMMVQEYGINIFRLSSIVSQKINKDKNINLKLNTKVKYIEKVDNGFIVDGEKFDYLVNSAGYQTGKIDDILGFKRDRYVEFKSAYITKCDMFEENLPEIVFLGERGTPNGMGQFTPYPNNHYQIHGMTKDITLFDECLSRSSINLSQPKLPDRFEKLLNQGWDSKLIEERTKNSIDHLSYFIPTFKSAKVSSQPLFGAQQIPGLDPELRAFEVSFEKDRYARCEIVKASSVIDMSRDILEDINSYGYVLSFKLPNVDIEKAIVDILAKKLAKSREYPEDLGLVNNPF